ncbi:hypothetical protein KAX97_12580 [candidate division WOR-3 bacterium]|nr:hypothetical protein [candidate division WOR-3 bacterium]
MDNLKCKVLNLGDLLMGLDGLKEGEEFIIVDDHRQMIVTKIRILPLKEEEILVQKKYTLNGIDRKS